MFSFEYHFAKFGKKLDNEQIVEIDYEYENQYRQGKDEILRRMRLSAKEEIKRREELLDFKDKTEKAEMEENIRRIKQQQADEEIASLEKEINIARQQKKTKIIKEYYINQSVQSISEMKEHIQSEVADNLNRQLEKYIATVNIDIMTKIKDKKQELDNIYKMYNNSSVKELKDRLKELENSIEYLEDIIVSEEEL